VDKQTLKRDIRQGALVTMSFLQHVLSALNATSLLPSAMKVTSQLSTLSTYAFLGHAASPLEDVKILNLSTVQWTLSSPQYPNISIPGSAPSQAHLDLYREGVIPDPYFGLNDFELRWVAYSNWTYTASLKAL
jgi:hypothetical protein